MPEEDEVTVRLAEEIVRYLRNHPDAADTVEGIAKWWLEKQRFEDSIVEVRKAVEYLEARQLIRRDAATGRVVCRRPPDTDFS